MDTILREDNWHAANPSATAAGSPHEVHLMEVTETFTRQPPGRIRQDMIDLEAFGQLDLEWKHSNLPLLE